MGGLEVQYLKAELYFFPWPFVPVAQFGGSPVHRCDFGQMRGKIQTESKQSLWVWVIPTDTESKKDTYVKSR